MIKIRVLNVVGIFVVGILLASVMGLELYAAPQKKSRAAKKGGKKRGGAKKKVRAKGAGGSGGGGGGAVSAAPVPVAAIGAPAAPPAVVGATKEASKAVPAVPEVSVPKSVVTTTGVIPRIAPVDASLASKAAAAPISEETKKSIARKLAQDAQDAAHRRILRQEQRALEIMQDSNTSADERRALLEMIKNRAASAREMGMDTEYQNQIDAMVEAAEQIVARAG